MPGGVVNTAAPGEEQPKTAFFEFKSDAEDFWAMRAKEALLISEESSPAT
jgi:hypothetical protein